MNKTFEMKGGSLVGGAAGLTPAQLSPELERNGDLHEDKYKKASRRWEMVLDRKH